MHRLLAIGLLAILLTKPVRAADDLEQWSSLLLVTHFNEAVSAAFLVQGRFNRDVSNPETLLLRPELSYNLSKNAQLSIGFDSFDHLDEGRPYEYRIWQQLGLGQDWGRVSVDHRLRVEQRFIEGVAGVVVRQRYRLRGQIWLDQDKRWLLYSSDEVFFNLNQPAGGPPVGFNQNRLQAGVGYRFAPGLRIEPGYQWIAFRDRNAQVLLLTLRVELDRLGAK